MANLGKAWQPLRVLHGALMASIVIYAGIVVMATNQAHAARGTGLDPKLLLGVLGGMAVFVLFVVLPILRAKMMPPLDRVGDGRDLDLSQPVTPELRALLGKLRPALIVTWALCESVAVLGLTAALLFFEPRYFAPFGAVALLAMVYFAPRVSLLEQAVRASRR